MTITQAGPRCDVCSRYIFPGEPMTGFGVTGIQGTLHCHDDCRAHIEAAGGDWTRLPAGPLRDAYERAVTLP